MKNISETMSEIYIGETFGPIIFKKIGNVGHFIDNRTGNRVIPENFALNFEGERGEIQSALVDTALLITLLFPQLAPVFTMTKKPVNETFISAKVTESVNRMIKEEIKPRYVRFFRHVCPLISDSNHPGYCEIDPLKGVTLKFELDYAERSINVWWSTCNGDNFSKSYGRGRAEIFASAPGRGHFVKFKMPAGGISTFGVVSDLFNSTAFGLLDPMTRQQITDTLDSSHLPKSRKN